MIKLKDIKLKPKLIGLFLLVSVIPLLFISWTAINNAKDALVEEAFAKLVAAREVQGRYLKSYYENTFNSAQIFSKGNISSRFYLVLKYSVFQKPINPTTDLP